MRFAGYPEAESASQTWIQGGMLAMMIWNIQPLLTIYFYKEEQRGNEI